MTAASRNLAKEWARAFAKQALSDLDARELLVQSNALKCHRLHFLQMAAEKACKAHFIASGGHDQPRKTHAYVAKGLPTLARFFLAQENPKGRLSSGFMAEIKKFAREIEVLAPALTDNGTREDNTEYPWQDAQGRICTPCEHSFQSLDDNDKSLVTIIKLIRKASNSYAR